MDAHSLYGESDSDDCVSISNKLGNAVDKVLKLRDIHVKQYLSDEDDDSEDEEKDEYKQHIAFTSRHKMFDCSYSDEETVEPELPKESLRKLYALAMSLPSPEDLTSAMKGSREKEGGSERKLTVTWASEVYDPPPTQLELILTRGTKQQKVPKKEKKSGKKAQKGKDFSRGGTSGKESSRGGGRDKKKKQHRGAGGASRRYDMFADDDDDGTERYITGVAEPAYENSNKHSPRWSGKDKKKQTRGMGGNLRRYDLPPSDDDDEEEEGDAEKVEAARTAESHCGSNIIKGSLKEVHNSVAKAL